MSANDKLEKVLRDMHVLISKSEVYSGDSIIVSKSEIFELLDRLYSGVYEIMDEYELTKQSRDRAEREFKKRGDKILFDSERKAEDVYAAAVMYTDEALTHLLSMMDESMHQIEEVQNHMLSELADKKRQIHDNQMELKSQLQDLVDTGKYLQLIEERNKEIKQEQEIYKTRFGGQKGAPEEQFANVKTEIKINKQYFKEHGLAVDDDDEEEEEDKKAAGKKTKKHSKDKQQKSVLKKKDPADKPRQTLLKTARELVMADAQQKADLYEPDEDELLPGEPETDETGFDESDKPEPFDDHGDSYSDNIADSAADPEIPVSLRNEDADTASDEGADDELAASIRDHELTEEEIKALSDDLDSEYFDWSGN
ncbi:MAG: hypothetical protein IKQ56_03160 [Lachnospiraceae bacterium]|nr:hypothetical protein [Lachnospiraceae bacterium]